MAAALRPGGWLLVEDADTAVQPLVCLDEGGAAQRRANLLRDAVRELLTRRSADLVLRSDTAAGVAVTASLDRLDAVVLIGGVVELQPGLIGRQHRPAPVGITSRN